MPLLKSEVERHSQEIEGFNGGSTPLSKPIFSEPKIKIKSQNSPNRSELASGKKNVRRGRLVTKKVSPKNRPRPPELKLLFEKIRMRKELAAVKKINGNENSQGMSPNSQRELKENASGKKSPNKDLIKGGDIQPQGDGKSVKCIVRKFENRIEENYRENYLKTKPTQPSSNKPQNKKRVDVLRKISTPIRKTASPSEKRRSDVKIKNKLSEFSDKTVYVRKNQVLNDVQGTKGKKISDFQRTLWDIWGPEKSKDGPHSGK